MAWSDQNGVWALRTSLAGLIDVDSLTRALRQSRPAELVAREGVLGDIAINPGGSAVMAWSSGSGVFLSTDSGGHWKTEKAAPSGSEPVVEFDKAGRLHMAYRYQREAPFFGRTAINPRIYYTVREGQGWRPSQVAAQGLSFHPAMALDGDQPIVGFQHEGMKALGRAGTGDHYLEDREGGGASIGYAASTDSVWKTGFVSQSHEIITRDRTVVDAYKGRIYPMVEQNGGRGWLSTSTACPGSSGPIPRGATLISPAGWAPASRMNMNAGAGTTLHRNTSPWKNICLPAHRR